MSDNYLHDMFSLDGQVAIVAGGSGVIGQVMAGALVAAGACVDLWGRSDETVETAVAAVGDRTGAPARVAGRSVDTSSETQVARAVQAAEKELGSPDILINAVGGNRGKHDFVDLDLTHFEAVLHLNLVAGLAVPAKILARYWIDHQRGGCVINLASMASYIPLSGVWAYNAAKAGVLNLTVGLAKELAPYRIRVNAIAPGFFLGRQNRALLVDEKTGSFTPRGQAVIDHTPFGRFGEPEELAGATLYLASEKASGFVTGVCIPVDGGYLADNV